MERDLAAFLAIAKTGSLSAAAHELAITQPALTKRLQNLEDRHGITLFDRRPRGMELTGAGRQFLHHARRIEQEYLQAAEAIDLLKVARMAELRVGAGPLFHIRYMADVWQRMRVAFPRLGLHLEAGVNPVLLPKLRSGELDMVLGASESLDPDDPLAFVPLLKVDVGVVMHRDNPLTRKAELAADDLTDFDWVVYSENPHFKELVANFFERSGARPPEFIFRTSSFFTGLQYVQRVRAVMTIPLQLDKVLPLPELTVVPTTPLISENQAGIFVRKSLQDCAEIRTICTIMADLTSEASRRQDLGGAPPPSSG
ncbi:LysR family transcriptional regulator [Marinovum sp.]|uniref:LysR family transcriptional regulator n=1 Tax=Marinovum sp. TaxID=2024839 RepID=UPI002B279723|nr:LysR family transcriptional regulator [Marinovum sp.]